MKKKMLAVVGLLFSPLVFSLLTPQISHVIVALIVLVPLSGLFLFAALMAAILFGSGLTILLLL
jgi:hypothetical protein